MLNFIPGPFLLVVEAIPGVTSWAPSPPLASGVEGVCVRDLVLLHLSLLLADEHTWVLHLD